jgi:Synergist-CTERM protein sorting domain-containing protein
MSLLLAPLAPGFDPEIADHLLEVVDTLRAETPATLPDDVRQRRLAMLDALEGYAFAGEFPEGPAPPRPRVVAPPRAFAGSGDRHPRFVDDDGSHCAVGYLVAVDSPELALEVARVADDAWLPEIVSPALDAWAAHHGFTRDELAWVQPTYDVTLDQCEGYAPRDTDPRPAPGSGCEGVDTSVIQLDWAPIFSCIEDCGPAIDVWVPVENLGTQASSGGEIVALFGTDEVLTQAALPEVDPGERRFVGPVTIDASKAGGLQVRVDLDGDCDTTNQLVELGYAFDYGMGGQLRGRDCPRDAVGERLRGLDGEVLCGCSSGSGAGWLAVLLPLLMRRRQRLI